MFNPIQFPLTFSQVLTTTNKSNHYRPKKLIGAIIYDYEPGMHSNNQSDLHAAVQIYSMILADMQHFFI